MSYVSEQLSRASARTTVQIAKRWGEGLGMWMGCGYPRSGTVWVSQLMSGYLDIPHPRHYLLPVAMEAVVHTHCRYDPRLPRCFYVRRDGRDVMVSLYFHRTAALDGKQRPRATRQRHARYERAFGADFDPGDVSRNLARFIELEMTDPLDTSLSWPEHILDWSEPSRRNVAYLGYEELVGNPLPQLTKALEQFLDGPVDEERLRETVERYEFRRQGGREPGTEVRSSFHRKGVVGDWRSYFNREAAEVFEHHAGPVLRMLGYEDDADWVKSVPG